MTEIRLAIQHQQHITIYFITIFQKQPKKMSTPIPNVSSVYRDLSHLYTSANTLNRSQYQNMKGYSLEDRKDYGYGTGTGNNNGNTKGNCFEDLYAYKQKRHDELMARLRNSSQEHGRLVGGLGDSTGYNSYTNTNNQYQYSSINPTKIPQPRPIPSIIAPSARTSNFIMPKIRYRHIEDQQNLLNKNSSSMQQQPQQQSHSQVEVQQLQKQFYEDIGTNKDSRSRVQQQGNVQGQGKETIGIQAKTTNNFKNQIMGDDGRSQASYRTNTFGKANRNSKYEDKIESYYELCRKTVSNKTQEANKAQEKQEKFIRPNVGKNKAMKLDEAIKLLSFD